MNGGSSTVSLSSVAEISTMRLGNFMVAARDQCGDFAAAPFKPLTVDRRCAGSSDRGVDIVCGGLVWRSFGARSESHHEQTDRIHRRIAELHLGAKPA